MLAFLKTLDAQHQHIQALTQLVECVRPRRARDHHAATNNLRALCLQLQQQPELATRLRAHLLQLLTQRSHTSLYTDIGVLSRDGFFSELAMRAAYRLLPPALNDTFLADALDELFYVRSDFLWIRAIPAADWQTLFAIIADARSAEWQAMQHLLLRGVLEAIRTLSYRICALGMEPRLTRTHSDLEKFTSPFQIQNVEINTYLDAYVKQLEEQQLQKEDASHCLVMLAQCDAVIQKIRKNALQHGTSVALTYLLVALNDNIERMRKLLHLVDAQHPSHPLPALLQPEIDIATKKIAHQVDSVQWQAALTFMMELMEAHHNRYTIRPLFSKNIDLLARNVTENASRTGEHYIAETPTMYRSMFVSSAGAGLVVSLMAMLKIFASYLRAAPLVEAFLFSMNYAFGFMLIHLLHFTVATKQPAMTAAHIAAGLHQKNRRQPDLENMVELTVTVIRTQFIAVLGNLLTAMPMALLIALLFQFLQGEHLVSTDKARHLLHDIDPFSSLALLYAMIAGICLFLAGLISGYYDNQALYTRMAQRVVQLRGLGKWIGRQRLQRLGAYLENNLGGLMGNFYFGILLGCAATLGQLTGLPIDIRHVTFSSANLMTAMVALNFKLSWQELLTAIAGIMGIGAVNLLVSFSLALWIALRARGARFQRGVALLIQLLKRFVKQPYDFFVFPRSTAPSESPETKQ